MENRKPFNLSLVTRVYNLYQIAGCIYFIFIGHKLGFSFRHMWKCIDEPKISGVVDENLVDGSHYLWFFIILRLSELLETVFFVLRKKFKQVSILHVYHHISTVVLLWIFLLYSGGMMEWFIGALNSAVHILMYGYYFLSSFNQCRKYTNFIKPVITFIQITQLFVIFGHSVAALLPGCNASWMFVFQMLNAGFLISMFVKFYVNSYIRNKVIDKMS